MCVSVCLCVSLSLLCSCSRSCVVCVFVVFSRDAFVCMVHARIVGSSILRLSAQCVSELGLMGLVSSGSRTLAHALGVDRHRGASARSWACGSARCCRPACPVARKSNMMVASSVGVVPTGAGGAPMDLIPGRRRSCNPILQLRCVVAASLAIDWLSSQGRPPPAFAPQPTISRDILSGFVVDLARKRIWLRWLAHCCLLVYFRLPGV